MASEIELTDFEKMIYECMHDEYYKETNSKNIVLKELAGILGMDPESDEGAIIAAIPRQIPLGTEHIIAATLWRILPYPTMDWLYDNPWRLIVMNQIEQNCTEKILDDKQMKAQGHEKLLLIAEKATEVDKFFIAAINHLTSLDRINPHREKLMRSIKSGLGQFIIMSFLPSDLDAYLGEVYKKLELYLNNYGTTDVVTHYDNAVVSINSLVSLLETKHNVYSQLLISELFVKMKGLIVDHFANNPAGKSSSVSMLHDEKKYPLNIVGNALTISLYIKNEGPGYANKVELLVIHNDDLQVANNVIQIGSLEPNQSQLVDIEAKITKPVQTSEILVEAKWATFKNDNCYEGISISLKPQNPNIPWDKLTTADPYSLEAVLTEADLVGRRDVLDRLTANCKNTVNSSIIKGQKRVGKTSIARALQSRLAEEGFIVIYLEGGDYVVPTPTGTIARLGQKLCKVIASKEPSIQHITKPIFTDALSPLVDYLDDIQLVVPEKRIVIILDEFDELPLDLYYRGPLGDSFFLTLRSISSKKYIGFVVVGGERMVQIIDCQGDQLNKWQTFDVDYFDKEKNWNDYKELIQRPVGEILEFADEAFECLHEYTAGNPFFTKVICRKIFENSVRARDGYIRGREVLSAIWTVASECDRNTFQHFWEDRILDTGAKAADKSIRRRKVLIAVSDLIEKHIPANIQNLMVNDLIKEVPSFEADLKEFESRNILILHNDEYDFKVKLFRLWLKDRGVGEIISTFVDIDALLRIKQAEEKLKIQPNEIVTLKSKFGMYKGQIISEDKIRAWLDQFLSPKEQRLMFQILDNCIFYSSTLCRSKLIEAHSIVKSRVIHVVEGAKQKRSDILVPLPVNL